MFKKFYSNTSAKRRFDGGSDFVWNKEPLKKDHFAD